MPNVNINNAFITASNAYPGLSIVQWTGDLPASNVGGNVPTTVNGVAWASIPTVAIGNVNNNGVVTAGHPAGWYTGLTFNGGIAKYQRVNGFWVIVFAAPVSTGTVTLPSVISSNIVSIGYEDINMPIQWTVQPNMVGASTRVDCITLVSTPIPAPGGGSYPFTIV